MNRVARVERLTHETQIMVELDLDGIGVVEVGTGVPFFDHMLAQLGKHGSLDLTVRAKGDVEIDAHHTVEDTAITLGQALREALGDKSGIARFGNALIPLDETLVQAVVDLSGRPYVVHHEPDGMAPLIGTYDTTLTRHIFESLAFAAGICLHVRVIEGRNPHHIVEAQFKAVARALRAAAAPDPRAGGRVEVTADAGAVLDCDGLAVPGVGAFAACMAGLRAAGGDKLIAQRLERGRPVLGICVGMQVLFAAGVEHGVWTEGCAAWPGTVERLDAGVLPHMGWNTVSPATGSTLFGGIPPGTRFYFVHSYALRAAAAADLAAT